MRCEDERHVPPPTTTTFLHWSWYTAERALLMARPTIRPPTSGKSQRLLPKLALPSCSVSSVWKRMLPLGG